MGIGCWSAGDGSAAHRRQRHRHESRRCQFSHAVTTWGVGRPWAASGGVLATMTSTAARNKSLGAAVASACCRADSLVTVRRVVVRHNVPQKHAILPLILFQGLAPAFLPNGSLSVVRCKFCRSPTPYGTSRFCLISVRQPLFAVDTGVLKSSFTGSENPYGVSRCSDARKVPPPSHTARIVKSS